MKKSIFTLLVLFISLSMVAQKGNPEKTAKKVVDEMTEVLSLNDDEAKKVYEIQLDKFQQILSIKAGNEGSKEELKAEIKKVNQASQKKLVAVYGKEKMGAWRDYLKANRKNKKSR